MDQKRHIFLSFVVIKTSSYNLLPLSRLNEDEKDALIDDKDER